jgi:hypothetical protein
MNYENICLQVTEIAKQTGQFIRTEAQIFLRIK